MTVWNPVRLSAMHHRQLAAGAVMVENDGWQKPLMYSSADEEMRQMREAAGLFDASSRAKISLQGDRLGPYLADILPGERAPGVGDVYEAVIPAGTGGAPVLLARLADDEALALGSSENRSEIEETLSQTGDRNVRAVDLTSGLAGVRITGPHARTILARATELDVSTGTFSDLRCARASFVGVHGTLLRVDIGAAPSYELYIGREFGEYVWEALLESARPGELAPVGEEAMASLREQA